MKRALRVVVPAIAILLAGILLFQTFHKAGRPGGNDLTSYLSSAAALRAGTNPYDTASPFPYLYPLFLAALLVPATFLPYPVVVLAWFALNLAALLLSLERTAAAACPRLARARIFGLAFPFLLLFFTVVQNNLLNGQVNFLVLWCCIHFHSSLLAGYRLRAAVALGSGIALKLVPLALAPFLLVGRRFRLLAAATAAAAVFALLPLAFLDADGVAHYAGYARTFLVGGLSHPPGERALDFSLRGLVSLVSPLPRRSPGTALVLAAMVLGATARIDARARTRGGDPMAAFALYLACIPLLSPMSETHHLAFALPGAFVCWLRAALDRESRRLSDVVLLGLFVGLYALGQALGRLAAPARGPLWCLALLTLGVALARLALAPGRLDGRDPLR